MPYKDKEARSEAVKRYRRDNKMDKALQREKTASRVKRYRDKQKSVTEEGVTSSKGQGVTLLKRPNGEPYNPDEMLHGRRRYLGPFSDGQVLEIVNSACPETVGSKCWRIPFLGMNSVIFTPSKGHMDRVPIGSIGKAKW